MRVLVVFLLAACLEGAQSPGVEDGRAMLLAVRQKVMQTVYRLPRYLCTETVDRSTLQPDMVGPTVSCEDMASMREKGERRVHQILSDRLRLDVAVSRVGEMYSWVGENHFEDRSLAQLVGGGATSTGTFSSFLTSIFGTNDAKFSYRGPVTAGGRLLREFGFRVPREVSGYRIGNTQTRETVGYSGTFLVDPQTSDLVRLTIHADELPSDLNICAAETTLDYEENRLNDSEFLLPKNVRFVAVNADGSEFDNRTAFSSCHEFLGESTLRFDTPLDDGQTAVKKGLAALALSSGLPFTISLVSPIKTKVAAAGDAIELRLTGPIRNKQHTVLVAKGARVTGRIMQIERHYHGRTASLRLAIRLEGISAGGVSQPFAGTLESEVKRWLGTGDPYSFQQRSGSQDDQNLGSFEQMEDPAVGVLQFEDVTSDYEVRPGLELKGRTAALK